MKYKALFLDLDGTTVPSKLDGMPSEKVREAIHQAKQKVFVCVATSRPLTFAKPVIDHLDISGLCSVNDSTQIYDPVKKMISEAIYLQPQDALQVYASLKTISEKFMVNDGIRERDYYGGTLPEHICVFAVPDISEKRADSIIEEMSQFPEVAAHKIYSYTKNLFWVSLTHATATKLHAVVRIAELLGVRTEEMIGVGDGYNDYPLLSACGLKIAMGNAAQELKAIADFIAPSVDEDGVATVIEKFILSP